MDSQLLAATIGAGVALAVSSLTLSLTGRREGRGRRTERTLARLERQIGDFYGPLLGLIEEQIIVEDIENRIIEAGRAGELTADQRAVVRRFIYEGYKSPIHERCTRILNERLYLVEGGLVHESFREYLRSTVQLAVQYRLWSERKIATDFIKGQGFPQDFADEVEKRLVQLLQRQDRIIRGDETPKGWSR
jgi:hypothetical protein